MDRIPGRSELLKAQRASYGDIDEAALRTPTGEDIRAGVAGGLPFDSLTTDVVRGCLPAGRVCYGNCFAAAAAFRSGENFGVRVPNRFSRDLLTEDLRALPRSQRYLRNGWNSDPSWNWPVLKHVADVVSGHGRLLVALTALFKVPDRSILGGLARSRVELRVSMSAFASPAAIDRRLETCRVYRELGGVAVPVVITARFWAGALNSWQDQIVDRIGTLDLPGAENSLRFSARSPVARQLMVNRAYPEDRSEDDLWFGRLYQKRLPVPTITSVSDGYSGLTFPRLSELDPEYTAALFADAVPTHEELESHGSGTRPRQAGVARPRP